MGLNAFVSVRRPTALRCMLTRLLQPMAQSRIASSLFIWCVLRAHRALGDTCNRCAQQRSLVVRQAHKPCPARLPCFAFGGAKPSTWRAWALACFSENQAAHLEQQVTWGGLQCSGELSLYSRRGKDRGGLSTLSGFSSR